MNQVSLVKVVWWTLKSERMLSWLVLPALALLFITMVKPVVWDRLLPDCVVGILTSENFSAGVQSISASIVAAFVFYILIEVLPRVRSREKKLEHLNALIFEVLNHYYRESLLQLPQAESIAVNAWQKKALTREFIVQLKKDCSDGIGLDDGSEVPDAVAQGVERVACAVSDRLPALHSSFSLAESISLDLSVRWMDLVGSMGSIGHDVPSSENISLVKWRRIRLLCSIQKLETWMSCVELVRSDGSIQISI
ncbi:hypothetical protein ACTSKR_11220 [Chitinibacteraceae bacterium HSL-7]